MAEVVGGHNEVLNNEALTAHATAITAIITIKLLGVCSAEREDGTLPERALCALLWPPSKGAAHLI